MTKKLCSLVVSFASATGRTRTVALVAVRDFLTKSWHLAKASTSEARLVVGGELCVCGSWVGAERAP